jgi:hypothetical protein
MLAINKECAFSVTSRDHRLEESLAIFAYCLLKFSLIKIFVQEQQEYITRAVSTSGLPISSRYFLTSPKTLTFEFLVPR